MRLNKQQRLVMHNKLLSPWENRNELDWLSFKEIMAKAIEQGLNRRTVIRHLKNELKFEKDSRGYNKVFYRPTQVFWAWILNESLKTEESFEEDKIIVWLKAKDEIDRPFDKLQDWYFEQYNRLLKEREIPGGGTGLSPENYNQLDSLIDRLLQVLETSLTTDFLAEGHELEDIYRLLVKNVTALLSAYTALWVFNSKIYAAPLNFDYQIKHMTEALKQFRKKRDS